MMRSKVDFPQPDGPSRQTSSPAATWRLAPDTATVRRPARRNVLPTESSTTWAPWADGRSAVPGWGPSATRPARVADGPVPRVAASAATGEGLLYEGRVHVGGDLRSGGRGGQPALADQELHALNSAGLTGTVTHVT